jgi:copper transport protein
MSRSTWRAGLAVVATLLCVLSAPAWAHGRLRSSVPAAGARVTIVPAELRLTFSEPAELAFTTVRLVTASGREITLGAVRFTDSTRRTVVAPVGGPVEPGRHVVRWQVAGADGHPVRGEFTFTVTAGAAGVATSPADGPDAPPDTASATPSATAPDPMAGMHHDPANMPDREGFGVDSPPYVLVRWLNFTALLLVIGAASFHWLVLRRLTPAADAPANGVRAGTMDDVRQRTAEIGLVSALALGVTLILRLLAQSYAMHGGPGSLGVQSMSAMVGTTSWGYGWIAQLAAVVLAVAGFGRVSGAVAGPAAARGWMLAAAGAVLGALAPALSGHAASVPSVRALAVGSDAIHVLAASSWLGTLAVMLVAGIGTSWRHPAAARGALVRDLVHAFSPVALACAGVAAVTGAFAAWLHVGGVTSLWTTRYGVTLLVKLAVLGVVALTGFHNWRRVQPRLGTDEATGALQRSARVEVGVAVLVLLVTAVLVATPPSMDAGM